MTDQYGIDASAKDLTVSPKDDFFRHVNGRWLNEVEIPSDKSIYGAFSILADEAEEAVKNILEEAAANPLPGVSQQIGDLYASFLDEDRVNELGTAPIALELKLIESATGVDDITKLLGEFERSGIGGLFGSYIDNDPGNPERYLINLTQGGLGLPDEAYYRDVKHAEILDAYLPHVTQMFALAGWSIEAAEQAAALVLSFETKLAGLHWSVVDSRDAEKTYNLTSLANLRAKTPTFDWDLYLSGALFPQEAFAEISVMMPSFFEQLGTVYNADHLTAIKAWASWVVIRSAAPYLSQDFINERFNFYGRKLTGAPENRARWKRAVSLVEGTLGDAVGEIYVQKHFPPAAKENMDTLVDWLIEAYRQSIQNLEWMTEETKQKALVKLSKFTPKIGYPKKFKDYSSIQIQRDDLFGNIRRISEWVAAREIKKIGAPLDRDEWFMNPQTVNAYYNPGFNEIVFPAAILQWPFYSLNSDAAVNFGGIGAVIGHEIGHGFDDQGSKYDGDGALVSWWTEADREAFEQRTKNLIKQFNELSPAQLDDSHKVNGELTIGENIGDLGGLGIAYKAYKLATAGQPDEVIDGLTGDQRFFESWAQSWRTKGRDELVIQRLATDPHSPPEFRVNQIVKNIDAFFDAYDIKRNDQMWLAPTKRVVIW